MPENAIVGRRSPTPPGAMTAATRRRPQRTGDHDRRGIGLTESRRKAVGAAVEAPDRPGCCLKSDGLRMYTIRVGDLGAGKPRSPTPPSSIKQRAPRHHSLELQRVGAGSDTRPESAESTRYISPDMDFVKIAEGMGVVPDRAHHRRGNSPYALPWHAEPEQHLVEARTPCGLGLHRQPSRPAMTT